MHWLVKDVTNLGDYVREIYYFLTICEVNDYDSFSIIKNVLISYENEELRSNRKISS